MEQLGKAHRMAHEDPDWADVRPVDSTVSGWARVRIEIHAPMLRHPIVM